MYETGVEHIFSSQLKTEQIFPRSNLYRYPTVLPNPQKDDNYCNIIANLLTGTLLPILHGATSIDDPKVLVCWNLVHSLASNLNLTHAAQESRLTTVQIAA